MAESGQGSGVAVESAEGIAIDLQPPFQKLKPGPGLPADQVLADQRRRLHGAMIALVDRSGWDGVRVRSLARTAGVSTATFYKHFVNADDCLASTYDAVMTAALQHAASVQRRQPDWRDSLRVTVATLMEDLADDPCAARLILLDIFSAGPIARKRIGRAVGELEQLLAGCFTSAPPMVTPPRHLVAGMTAGMLRVARTTTLAGRGDELRELAAELGDWMLALPDPEVLSLLVAQSGTATTRARREPRPFPAENSTTTRHSTADDSGRLMRATIKLASLEGFAKLTPSRLRSEAGVSRRSFDACFGSLDECFLEAIEMIAREAAGRSRSWSENVDRWELRTCRFVLALCAQAARNRAHARLLFLGVFATGSTGVLRREQMIGRLAAGLQATAPAGRRPSLIAAEASVAAVWHIAQSDVAAGRVRNLPSIAPLLSYVLLAPIIGAPSASAAAQPVGTAAGSAG